MYSNLYPISHTIIWRKHNWIIFRVKAAETQSNGQSQGRPPQGAWLLLVLFWLLRGIWCERSWVYEIVRRERGNSFSPSSDVIFLDFWPLLCLCLGGEGMKILENHHHRRFQFSLSPLSCSTNQFSPFFLRWHVETRKGLFTASVPLHGAQGPPRVQSSQSARLLLRSNSGAVLTTGCLSSVRLSVYFWVAVGGREGFVERGYIIYELEVKTQHSAVSPGEMGGTV